MSEYQIENRSGGDLPVKQDDLIKLAKIISEVIERVRIINANLYLHQQLIDEKAFKPLQDELEKMIKGE